MVAIAKTLFLRDLRGKWVFPRLLYSVAAHGVDRASRKALAFFIARPWRRIVEFNRTLHDHRESAEVLLAAFAVLSAVVRAYAWLVAAFALLLFAIAKL